ncbi:MAG: hypothetical protein DRI34_05205 [Deltaproteobacteria bacterium]|nr:MAG: hypothetical protein DRI34_05205 [Deltaproteobacteria bacterium]
MRKGTVLSVLAILLVTLGPSSGWADEPVVANQLYDNGGRFEVVLSPSMSVVDKYTRHVGISASLDYFFTDYLGLELDFGYNFISSDRKLLNEILRTSTTLQDVQRLPLTDLKRMTWFGNLGLVISPLYGKLNFSAELAVSIHLYFVLGAGVAQYKYSELQWSGGQYTKNNVTYSGGLLDASIQPTFHFGGGLLFHINQHWRLRVELRDIFFYDDYDAQVNDQISGVQDKKITDFNHTTFLRLGVGYAF